MDVEVNSQSSTEVDELELAIPRRQDQLWLETNRYAIESSNAFVEEHGLPLAGYRIPIIK